MVARSGSRPTRQWSALCLAGLLVLAGCSLGPSISPLDPTDDGRLGHEGGYAATDDLPVTADDGLNESERAAVVARTMARVERIRGREFTEEVPVRIVFREEYRGARGRDGRSAAARARDDQLWEASFVVDESTSVADAVETVYGAAVLGFYADGEIVIVSDSETPALDTRTLAHELVHALQDQHADLGFGPARPTRDGDLAREGLIEGDASYVEDRYAARCETWDCLPIPDRGDRGRPNGFNEGIYATLVQPYVDGPAFVAALRDRGNWTAVDDAYGEVPASTERTIHPEAYPDESPAAVEVPDRSSAAWSRFDVDQPTDTLGEASIYVTLSRNGAIGDDHEQYNYSHPISSGWAGDQIVPYHDGDDGADADRYGYVWRIEWDTAADARAFLDGYRAVLAGHNATRDGDVYVIPDGGYADAFRVTRDGTTVTIVNAPTRSALDELHAAPVAASGAAPASASGPASEGNAPRRPPPAPTGRPPAPRAPT
jgi:hypothetical protein